MKKYLLYTILYLILTLLVSTIYLYGIDMEIARRDYLKSVKDGNYEVPITGCIFDFVCSKYTEELQK